VTQTHRSLVVCIILAIKKQLQIKLILVNFFNFDRIVIYGRGGLVVCQD
jgi:hypothetical protein